MTVPKITAALVQTLMVVGAIAQASPQPDANPPAAPTISFDVSSVKENRSGSGQESYGFPPNSDRFSATNASLLPIIQLAYGMEPTPMSLDRVIGAPGWLGSAHFDIEAKVAADDVSKLRGLTPEQTMQLLKPLLADRFRLQAHIETRDFPEYALVLAKNGPKLTEAKPGNTYADGLKAADGRPAGPGAIRTLSSELTGQAISASRLAQTLRSQVGLIVVDRTGLAGKYDIHLTYAPRSGLNPGAASSDDSNQASLFTALQEQLGLKLESIKAPMDFLIIDSIQRPSEN